eukprot:1364333-Amphidinium_carterae.1
MILASMMNLVSHPQVSALPQHLCPPSPRLQILRSPCPGTPVIHGVSKTSESAPRNLSQLSANSPKHWAFRSAS